LLSATRNFASHRVQMTIMVPRPGAQDYTRNPLDTKGRGQNNPAIARTYLRGQDEMSDERIERTETTTATPETSAGEREPKVIKRYTNRKLYDTEESRYVTLDEIARMIKAGGEVKIIDNRTKEDLTSVTLAQIIFEEEKKTSKMSLETLRDLIRHGGEVAQRLVEGTQAELRGRVEAVRAAAEQRVQSLITRGQDTRERALELVQASQEAMVAVQRRVDERVRAAMEGMSNLSEVRRQLEEIARRIGELESRLDEIAKKGP
jgi:polyhydroxyalkanoate synthesis repressor PhaR